MEPAWEARVAAVKAAGKADMLDRAGASFANSAGGG